MRLLQGIFLAALSGLAAGATQPAAEVYILEPNARISSGSPQLPKEVARHILLQRVSRLLGPTDRQQIHSVHNLLQASKGTHGRPFLEIPETIDQEMAIGYIETYGKSSTSLFDPASARDPSQLIVIFEGVTTKILEPLKNALSSSYWRPAFTIADPPSAPANDRLVSDFPKVGASVSDCDLDLVINPFDPGCWEGSSTVAKYDVQEKPKAIQTLVDNLDRLHRFISNGDLEATLVLIPEPSRTSGTNSWGSSRSSYVEAELRRRDSELIISEADGTAPTTLPTWFLLESSDVWIEADVRHASRTIPQCFPSENTCMTQTRNCSGHGYCENKNGNDTTTKDSCFACVCRLTVIGPGDMDGTGHETQQWGGHMCQKKDISVPFWLLTGFTIFITGAVSSVVGMLFALGQEKLPGVIGAGVGKK